MNKPMVKFKCENVSAAIFENVLETDDGRKLARHDVQIQRTYKDKEGNFQHTNTFRDYDLPKVILVAQKAYEELTLMEEEPRKASAQKGEGQDVAGIESV